MKIDETSGSPNQSGRYGHKPQLIVLHLADGTYEGTKAWFAQSKAQTASHFVLALDGRICRCVPLERAAWCNGTEPLDRSSSKWNGLSTVPLVKNSAANANLYSVSIECEGFWSKAQGALTAPQLDSLVWLCRYIQTEVQRIYGCKIPWDRQHIVGHCEITPRTRANCPGQKFPWDALMARLQGREDIPEGTVYRVQVGAFSTRENALRFRDGTVLPTGIDAFLRQGEDGLWRVQVGLFRVRGNADHYLAQVREKGLEAFLVMEAE